MVEEPVRVAVEPVRDGVAELRTEADPVREPGVVRETLVRPVELRRTPLVFPLVDVLPPARVRPELRPEAPPREAKLRELREPSR